MALRAPNVPLLGEAWTPVRWQSSSYSWMFWNGRTSVRSTNEGPFAANSAWVRDFYDCVDYIAEIKSIYVITHREM